MTTLHVVSPQRHDGEASKDHVKLHITIPKLVTLVPQSFDMRPGTAVRAKLDEVLDGVGVNRLAGFF